MHSVHFHIPFYDEDTRSFVLFQQQRKYSFCAVATVVTVLLRSYANSIQIIYSIHVLW